MSSRLLSLVQQTHTGTELARLLSEEQEWDFLAAIWCCAADFLRPGSCSTGDWLLLSRRVLPDLRQSFRPYKKQSGWPWPERQLPDADQCWPAWPVAVLDERWVIWPLAEDRILYDLVKHRQLHENLPDLPLWMRSANLGGLVWKFRTEWTESFFQEL